MPSAGEAWARVKKAASWYGYYRPDDARRELGEDIWRAVRQVGGWREICAGDSPLWSSIFVNTKVLPQMATTMKATKW